MRQQLEVNDRRDDAQDSECSEEGRQRTKRHPARQIQLAVMMTNVTAARHRQQLVSRFHSVSSGRAGGSLGLQSSGDWWHHEPPMLKRLLLAAVATLLATGIYATQSVPAADSARASATATDRVLSDAVGRRDIPGVVAIAADRRGILYQGAFGVADVASGRPLTIDAIFRIASMTKPVTTVAAMQLIE